MLNSYLNACLALCLIRFLINVKGVVANLNQEKALIVAFSVIVKLREGSFPAVLLLCCCWLICHSTTAVLTAHQPSWGAAGHDTTSSHTAPYPS